MEANNKTNSWRIELARLLHWAFWVFLLSYFFFWLLEVFFNGLVANYLNLNIFLGIAVFSGLVFVCLREKWQLSTGSPNSFLLSAILAIMFTLIAYQATSYLGKGNIVLSALIGVVSYLVIQFIAKKF